MKLVITSLFLLTAITCGPANAQFGNLLKDLKATADHLQKDLEKQNSPPATSPQQPVQANAETKPTEATPVHGNPKDPNSIADQQGAAATQLNTPSTNEIKSPQDPDKLASEAKRAMDQKEVIIFYALGALFWLASFFAYIKFPKYRFASISTPFDLGAAFDSTEAGDAVKSKRRWIEFGLLSLSLIVYFWTASLKTAEGSGIVNTVLDSAVAFLYAYLIFVLGRFTAGFMTRCPSCKNTFASKCTNSYTEPKSTFEKVSNGVSGSRNVQFVKVMETGIKHADYVCTVCAHQWHEATQYTKQLSEHMRG